MSDIQLFRLYGAGTVNELASQPAPLEKILQTLIEGPSTAGAQLCRELSPTPAATRKNG
jgi:hypothetical protein